MSKNKGGWDKFMADESLFDLKVRKLIVKRLEPFMESLNIESDEELLIACVSLLTTSIRLLYQLGLSREEVEHKLLNTLDLVWVISELVDSMPTDGNIH
tara:strand:+ start:157 stop:453 length:297 start_codon:yes stop_codon:yes gene_type:complete